MTETPIQQVPRTYLAEERTFLAWMRTGLALMGVGFAVSRFGLFLRQFQDGEAGPRQHTISISNWSGIGLVLIGVVVTVMSTVRHVQITRRLKAGTWTPQDVPNDAVVLAIVLAVAGFGMAAYLMLVR